MDIKKVFFIWSFRRFSILMAKKFDRRFIYEEPVHTLARYSLLNDCIFKASYRAKNHKKLIEHIPH